MLLLPISRIIRLHFLITLQKKSLFHFFSPAWCYYTGQKFRLVKEKREMPVSIPYMKIKIYENYTPYTSFTSLKACTRGPSDLPFYICTCMLLFSFNSKCWIFTCRGGVVLFSDFPGDVTSSSLHFLCQLLYLQLTSNHTYK